MENAIQRNADADNQSEDGCQSCPHVSAAQNGEIANNRNEHSANNRGGAHPKIYLLCPYGLLVVPALELIDALCHVLIRLHRLKHSAPLARLSSWNLPREFRRDRTQTQLPQFGVCRDVKSADLLGFR